MFRYHYLTSVLPILPPVFTPLDVGDNGNVDEFSVTCKCLVALGPHPLRNAESFSHSASIYRTFRRHFGRVASGGQYNILYAFLPHVTTPQSEAVVPTTALCCAADP